MHGVSFYEDNVAIALTSSGQTSVWCVCVYDCTRTLLLNHSACFAMRWCMCSASETTEIHSKTLRIDSIYSHSMRI